MYWQGLKAAVSSDRQGMKLFNGIYFSNTNLIGIAAILLTGLFPFLPGVNFHPFTALTAALSRIPCPEDLTISTFIGDPHTDTVT